MAKVAVVIPYRFVPPVNGGHAAAFGFCEFLAKEREVVVVSTTNNAAVPLPFRLERLFQDRIDKYLSPLVALRFWRFFKKEKISHCVIQQPFIGLIIMPIVKLLGIQLLVYSHNLEFQRFKTIGKWWWRLLWLVEWYVYRAAEVVLFISRDDLREAIPIFKLNAQRCFEMPYGTRYASTPPGRAEARAAILQRHGFQAQDFLMLFFGSLSYEPNTEALERILNAINPILLQKATFPYRIMICGSKLPARFHHLTSYLEQNIHYIGFVDDIDEYIQASDVTLNPVTTGGGVKTKMVEAIALGTPVISAATGAKGIDPAVCGNQLIIKENTDMAGFAEAIIQLKNEPNRVTPSSFYDTYFWAKAIEPALEKISEDSIQAAEKPE